MSLSAVRTDLPDAPAAARGLKVLFVHFGGDRIAGSEVALLEMLRWFPKHGVQAELWCNAEPMRAAAEALGVPARRDADLTYYLDYSSPPFSAGGYLRIARRAAAMIEASGADVVHCNSAAPAQWMRPACWRAGVPMLVNLHSSYLRRSRYVLGLHAADRIVAVANDIVGPLLEDGMDPRRVSVVHNGFDAAAVLKGDARGLRDALGVPADATVGAIAGSLLRLKGHDLVFAAMRQLDAPRPFHLLVIGDGPEREAYQALAADLPVHFLGHRNDVGAVLRDNVDVLVAPSRQEAFGRVIIEAALGGVPAIGARVGGIPEAIVEGETGLLIPTEDPGALAASLRRLMDDEPLRRTLGAAARTRAHEAFSIEACTARMAQEYRLTIDGSGGGLRRATPYLNLARPRALQRRAAP